MHLTPEERQIGKQNFDEATGTTRREFLTTLGFVGGTAAVVGLGAKYFNYAPVEDRLRVGIIGTGDEGGVLIGAINPAYIDVVAITDIRPYSLHRAFYGDWYSTGAHAARPGLLAIYKDENWANREAAERHIKVYDDKRGGYEALLKDPNVEAVIIALPLHLHHKAAVDAMRAGKHVLTEKLMAHDVAQCKQMARVAAASKDAAGNPIILAVGHQRHYSILYDNAVQQIKQGLIGDIHHIRAQWHRGNLPGNDSWQPPLPCPFLTEEQFKAFLREARTAGHEVEYRAKHKLVEELYAWQAAKAKLQKENPNAAALIDEWQKKLDQKKSQINDITDELAQKYGYQAKELSELRPPRTRTAQEELIRWRLWDRTGGGLMAELGSHQLDAASIFISAQDPSGRKVKPLSVTGVGGRHVFPADRDCDDHVYCVFEFPAPGYYRSADTHEVADPNKKIVVTYSSINGNGFGGYGEVVFGTKGTLILEQEQEAMLFRGSDTTTKIEVREVNGKAAMDTYETGGGAAVAQAATGGNTSRGYREEIEHWAWCIRNPDPAHKPRCTPEVALGDAVIALTSNLAIKKGQRIEFDEAWFNIDRSETPEGNPPLEASQVT
jgi:predicted dehydrogenase